GLRKHVKLAASGKVYSGMGLAQNLAIGADWCNAARAFMFSIGCIQSKRCHEGTCPTGITTQDPLLQRGLVPEVQGERAARFHRKTVEALADIVAAAGLTHPNDLRPHHLTTRRSGVEAHGIQELHTFLAENSLINDPNNTPYASWWRAADAHSFSPRHDPDENVIASSSDSQSSRL
ncbi:MAG: glutamate synthase-related protein, partial [Oleibacter sp.]|nr:glutamate synthase-related protein [Thalassolituus sp.]